MLLPTAPVAPGREGVLCLSLSPIKRTVKSLVLVISALMDTILSESQAVLEIHVLPVGASESLLYLLLSLGDHCHSGVLLKRLMSLLLPAVGSCVQMMPTWLAMFMEGPF